MENNQDNLDVNEKNQQQPDTYIQQGQQSEQPKQNSYVQPQTPAPSQPSVTSGLAVGGLVTGIVAIIGSWIPFLNIVSLIIGIVALGLSIPALITTLKGTKKGKGLAIAGLVLGVATIVIFVVMSIAAASVAEKIVDDAIDDAYDELIDDTYNDLLDDSQEEEPIDDDDSSSVTWKQFLKEYETFVDDYIALLEKYEKNPADIDILNDYLELTEDMVEWAEKAETIEGDLSGDDLDEYLEAVTRITNKLTGLL